MKRQLIINGCTECPFHRIAPDPGADSFDAVDVKLICTKTKRKQNVVTGSNRPWQTKKESTPPPKWCPLDEVKT